jgi:hypothetical protein
MVRENIMIISGSKGGYPEGAKSKSLLLTQEKEMKAKLVLGPTIFNYRALILNIVGELF